MNSQEIQFELDRFLHIAALLYIFLPVAYVLFEILIRNSNEPIIVPKNPRAMAVSMEEFNSMTASDFSFALAGIVEQLQIALENTYESNYSPFLGTSPYAIIHFAIPCVVKFSGQESQSCTVNLQNHDLPADVIIEALRKQLGHWLQNNDVSTVPVYPYSISVKDIVAQQHSEDKNQQLIVIQGETVVLRPGEIGTSMAQITTWMYDVLNNFKSLTSSSRRSGAFCFPLFNNDCQAATETWSISNSKKFGQLVRNLNVYFCNILSPPYIAVLGRPMQKSYTFHFRLNTRTRSLEVVATNKDVYVDGCSGNSLIFALEKLRQFFDVCDAQFEDQLGE